MKKIGKVIIGISGGVDSSVSAYLLKEKGYEVIGVTFIQSEENKDTVDMDDAKKICNYLGIEHKIYDISKEFKEEVISYFLEGYKKGITPSPCVICDEKIKIKKLLDICMEENGDYIATGHYCKINRENKFHRPLLEISEDRFKDQSYMLYRVKPESLEKIIFPLFGYKKNEVRSIAEKIGLKVHDKKDSQGICFAKEGYIPYLKEHLKDSIKKGKFIKEDGTVIGEHEGYQLYTVGQRRGLGLKLPEPVFILEIRPETNEIVLGEYEKLKRKKIKLINISLNVPLEELLSLEVIGRPRFSSQGFLGKLLRENDDIYFEYREENYQNSPGQHIVFYYENLVLGGGEIK